SVCKHQADVQKADVRITLGQMSLQYRLHDTGGHVSHQCRRRERAWRERAHTTSVWAPIAVKNPFVILRCPERYRTLAIAEKECRYFGARQAFLNHEARTGGSELLVDHRGPHGGLCLRTIRRAWHT